MAILPVLPLSASAEERPGKAVFLTSPELGMKIGEKALKNIEVKLMKFSPPQAFPVESIVRFQDQTGVYRVRQGWFKLVPVQFKSTNEQLVSIQSKDLQAGDEIAVHGADLLRVSEMDAFGSGE